jgi:hypothetical protein
MSQLSSHIAHKRSVSPAKGAKRLLELGRKHTEGIEAGIEGLLARVGVIGVVSDLSATCSACVLALHLAKTFALLRAAFIIDWLASRSCFDFRPL